MFVCLFVCLFKFPPSPLKSNGAFLMNFNLSPEYYQIMKKIFWTKQICQKMITSIRNNMPLDIFYFSFFSQTYFDMVKSIQNKHFSQSFKNNIFNLNDCSNHGNKHLFNLHVLENKWDLMNSLDISWLDINWTTIDGHWKDLKTKKRRFWEMFYLFHDPNIKSNCNIKFSQNHWTTPNFHDGEWPGSSQHLLNKN